MVALQHKERENMDQVYTWRNTQSIYCSLYIIYHVRASTDPTLQQSIKICELNKMQLLVMQTHQ